LAKTKGGPGHLVPKKRTFLGRQKFLADYVAGGPKIWPDEKNCWFGRDLQGFFI